MFKSKNIRRRRDKLTFTLAPSNVFTYTYGQAIEVPDLSPGIECRYFITEAYEAGATADTVQTRPLYGVYDIMTTANNMWETNPTTLSTAINGQPKGAYDWIAGTLFLKGKDIYTIRNQSNEDVWIQAYYCTFRKDYNQNDGQQQNVYRLLGRGFAERGYDAGNAGAFNNALYRADINPFDSPLFTRLVKITRVTKFKIKPGEYKKKYLKGGWKRYRPIEYVTPSSADEAWSLNTQKYDWLKGSKFILFRVVGNPAMVTGQTVDAWARQIGQTTPMIIMATQRHYEAKHLPLPTKGLVTFVSSGTVAGADPVFMGDTTKSEMKETEAE